MKLGDHMTRLVIRDIFDHPNISIRSSITLLRESLEQLDSLRPSIELDFSDMNFISRSFAHELLELINALQLTTSVDITNTVQEIEQMLSTVSQSMSDTFPKDRQSLLPDFSEHVCNRNFFE